MKKSGQNCPGSGVKKVDKIVQIEYKKSGQNCLELNIKRKQIRIEYKRMKVNKIDQDQT